MSNTVKRLTHYLLFVVGVPLYLTQREGDFEFWAEILMSFPLFFWAYLTAYKLWPFDDDKDRKK